MIPRFVLFSHRSKDDDLRYISTHTPFTLRIGESFWIPSLRGRLAVSIESAYQAAKFALLGRVKDAIEILDCSAIEAERRGRDRLDLDLEIWTPLSFLIMGQLLRIRAGADARFREILIANRRRGLAHRHVACECSTGASRWSMRYERKSTAGPYEWVGENQLGRLLDQIGDELINLPIQGELGLWSGSSQEIIEGWLSNALLGL